MSIADELPEHASMRDVFDLCQRHGLENLAQGMIEVAPPLLLRKMLGTQVTERGDISRYRNRMGEKEYLSAVVKLLKEVFHTEVPVEAVLGTCGVSGGVVSALHMLKSRIKGRSPKVGLLDPFYTFHAKQVQAVLGVDAVNVRALDTSSDQFPIVWEKLEAVLPELDLLIVPNPGNPTGIVLSQGDLTRLVELTGHHSCMLLLDEVYADLVWSETGAEFYSPIQRSLEPHVLAVRSFSKSLGAQSWRVGFVVSSPEVIQELMMHHDPVYLGVPLTQHAVAAYLNEHMDDYKAHVQQISTMMQNNLETIREAMAQVLPSWKYIKPQGSMYCFYRHNEATDLAAVSRLLDLGVGTAAGSMFFAGHPPCSGFLRIHVGVTEEKATRIAANMVLKNKNKK